MALHTWHRKNFRFSFPPPTSISKEERQAAVEAILSAGHIPAGMELFTAGDQSQWEVIKEWIRESDVYMLILGGRYGSIEPESGKSYTHLEYEYAVEIGKPLFAVVLTEKALDTKAQKDGLSVIERNNSELYNKFKSQVMGKLIKQLDDLKDVKLAVHETLNKFARKEELIGWVRGNQVVDNRVVGEMARLAQENNELRNILNKTGNNHLITGLSIEEQYSKIAKIETTNDNIDIEKINSLLQLTKKSIIGFFYISFKKFNGIEGFEKNKSIDELVSFKLIELSRYANSSRTITVKSTDDGSKFYHYIDSLISKTQIEPEDEVPS